MTDKFNENKDFVMNANEDDYKGLAKQFLKGCKKYFKEYKEPTEEEREHYRRKLDEMTNAMVKKLSEEDSQQ